MHMMILLAVVVCLIMLYEASRSLQPSISLADARDQLDREVFEVESAPVIFRRLYNGGCSKVFLRGNTLFRVRLPRHS